MACIMVRGVAGQSYVLASLGWIGAALAMVGLGLGAPADARAAAALSAR